MSKLPMLLLLLPIVGCGPSQPPELQNAVITVTGKPNSEFYLSVNQIIHTVNGRNSKTEGTGDYGKRVFDDTGKFELKVTQAHGVDVVLVALTDVPIKVLAKADNASKKEAETSGQLSFAHVKIGYAPDEGSMFASDPEDSVYEAKILIEANAKTE